VTEQRYSDSIGFLLERLGHKVILEELRQAARNTSPEHQPGYPNAISCQCCQLSSRGCLTARISIEATSSNEAAAAHHVGAICRASEIRLISARLLRMPACRMDGPHPSICGGTRRSGRAA
jgi:hypothetical protein